MTSARRIGIDGFNIGMVRGSGIATYARNLNAGLRALGYQTQILYGPRRNPGRNALVNEIAVHDAQPPDGRWDLLLKPFRTGAALLPRPMTRVPKSGEVITRQVDARAPPADVVWSARDVFNRANRRHQVWKTFTPVVAKDRSVAPELMHWTCPLPLRLTGAPNVYTIHDLVPLRLPYATLDDKGRFFQLCKRICRQADHIVTVSETTRDDVMRIYGVPPERITNTYQAVDIPQRYRTAPEADIVRELEGVFDLPWRGYFLYFGAVEPKKNLPRIIQAYLASGVKTPLVIVGGKGWLAEDETRLLYDDIVGLQTLRDGVLRRSDRIRRYDYLPFPLLVSVIRGARATLFPSLYEGFGLPVLESMLLGTPVLTSGEGALPEVAGDAALMVDAYDAGAITEAIRRLDADEDLRADLAARGAVQALRFSPQAYQSRLADLYGRLL